MGLFCFSVLGRESRIPLSEEADGDSGFAERGRQRDTLPLVFLFLSNRCSLNALGVKLQTIRFYLKDANVLKYFHKPLAGCYTMAEQIHIHGWPIELTRPCHE